MILRGSVGVFIEVPKKRTNAAGDANEEQREEYDLVEVNSLRAGDNFGELAILNPTTRSATIICKEKTDFATLSGDDFKTLTGNRQ